MLAARSRGETRSAHCVRCARTIARESDARSARVRAPTVLLRFSPPHKSPPPGTAHRAAPTRGVRRECHHRGRQSRGRVCVGSDICGAEQRRARGRARQRASCSDSPRLFERNDRREWSEFLGGPRDRAAQGTPRAARGCRIRAPAHTRPRLCSLRPFERPAMNSTIAQLETFASALFKAAGLDADKATTLAQLLVLTDALGRRTHGLAMAPLYLAELAKGTMSKSGEPEVVKQRGVVALWDGGYLPGQYVVARAIDWALPRAAEHGIAAVTIRRSHHIGCLAALALRAVGPGLRRVDRQLRPGRRARRALRRHRGAVHARSVRDRLSRHTEPGAGRHLRVDHHHLDDAPEGAPRARSSNSPGCSTTKAGPPPTRACSSTARRAVRCS